jgi:uncharacterized membrane protein YhdT
VAATLSTIQPASTPALEPTVVSGQVFGTTPALTTRFLDFWLLGGASLVVWFVMVALDGLRASPAVEQHFTNLTATTLSLALILNYPHFLFSYKLAYGRGGTFVLTHWWSLIAVPLALIALFAVAYQYFDVRVDQVPWILGASNAVAEWGVNQQVLAGPRVGDVLFTAAFNLMLLTIGWHYTKQVFGCMMVYAHLDGYAMTRSQRDLTKWALLSIWGLAFVDTNVRGDFRAFAGFSYSSLDLPDVALPVAGALVAAGFALVLHKVFYANYRSTGRRPGVNMVVPFVALYVWWLPSTRQEDFYFLLVPLFHSLQYLAFVYKVEHTRLRGQAHREIRGTVLIAGIVLAGWLAFEFVPTAVDERPATFDTWGVFFFVIAAMLFINIHHYFIDSVVWRLKDPHVRAHLLG